MFTILVSNETSVVIPEILILKTYLLINGNVFLVFFKCFCPNHKHFIRKIKRLGGGGGGGGPPPPPPPPPPRPPGSYSYECVI